MNGVGAIAMAVYDPDPELFATQLQSIQQQSVQDFVCIISADSDPERIRALTVAALGDDPRFVVHGDGTRKGFYLNFEAALTKVPADAAWVAFADQDDRWYPTKLARLLPALDGFGLVSGQARVIRHPDDHILLSRTKRRAVPFDDLVVQNQVTGAQSVFRRELLDLALPFPRVHAVTALHDHWLAVCAAATSGWTVVDEVLQDYVQHGANLIGEVEPAAPDVWAAARRIRQLADGYENGHSLGAQMRVCNRLSFGWRRAMLAALQERCDPLPEKASAAWEAFKPDHSNWKSVRFLVDRLRSGYVLPGTVATFLPGLVGEMLRSTRQEMTASIGTRAGWAGADQG